MPDYEGLDAVTYESLYQQVATNQIISLIVVIVISAIVVFTILFGIMTCYRSSKIYVNACRIRDEHAIKLSKTALVLSVIGMCLLNLVLVLIVSGMVRDYNRTDWFPDEDEDED